MIKSIFRRSLGLLLCLLLLPTNTPARASSNLGTQIEAATIGAIVGASALVVLAVILIVHHKPGTVKGCVVSGPNGLEVVNSTDKLTYELNGGVTDIKPGELVKVKGKKKVGKGGAPTTFTVMELSKDYGACPVAEKP